MIETMAFLLLAFLSVVGLAGVLLLLIFRGIAHLRKKTHPRQLTRLKKMAIFSGVVLVLNIGLMGVTQFTASTPRILDEKGNPPANSIAELTRVELNGRKQWISIRGWDQSKPILLFLAGGPGGSQLAAVRHELSELEKHFVVVGWDQPGSAKSYYATSTKKMTPETYIQDGHALTQYLLSRFGQQKIYLVGESWGSALGIFLIDRHPEDYHAFIGTGQMVDFAETERIDYQKAMEIAKQRNDTGLLQKLQANGQPPYYGKDVTWKSAAYLNYLSAYMASNPQIHNPGYNTLRDVFSPEYGLVDKINFFRGIINTFNHVYQQLYEIDLRKSYTSLKVPVYFFEGRHDVNAPPELVQQYFELLQAPDKKLIWFEHSGHSPWINETDRFVEELLACFGEGAES